MEWKDKDEADKQIDLHLKPILESWIGGRIPLNFTKVYGVRRYLVIQHNPLRVDFFNICA
jgi:hypothetical protein